MFQIMGGLPVTIRLLDPPLHEFLPHGDEEIKELAASLKMDASALRARLSYLKEQNPMLGHRGCRLGVSYPEISEMQARAIFEAAVEAGKKTGSPVVPEVMVPLIATKAELDILKAVIDRVAKEVEIGHRNLDFLSCRNHDRVAACGAPCRRYREDGRVLLLWHKRPYADDVWSEPRRLGTFLGDYLAQGIFDIDPFVSLDPEGVGELVQIAADRGRKTRPGIKLGICGEHGGDPASIEICEKVGLDYVSCSPFRVPVARLAAAQAAVRSKGMGGTHSTA